MSDNRTREAMKAAPREIVQIAGQDNGLRHVLFARLCLGWSWLEALHVRIDFGHVPLSEETMHKMLEAESLGRAL